MFGISFKKKNTPEKPKTLGQLGEEFAQSVYRKKGFEVLAANVYNKTGLRKGEIDFVAKNRTQLVFVEVKTRKQQQGRFGSGEEAVNIYKQHKLLTAVKLYLLQHPDYANLRPQIDVCVVGFNQLDNCFECDKIISNAVEDQL
jgi:putative endonuclease